MTVANRWQDLREVSTFRDWCHGSFESTKSEDTIVEEDYYSRRHPDLAGDPAARRRVIGRRGIQQQPTPLSTPPRRAVERNSHFSPTSLAASSPATPASIGEETDVDQDLDMADASQQATQQATQPYENPRRTGRNLSDISEDDATDVICLLHPSGPLATQACKATMLHASQHILQNEDLDGITEEDMMFSEQLQGSRDFALRMSSTVKIPKDGFRFGRNPHYSDILLSANTHDTLISNVHFKIFVNSQGSLMIQDMSTNGTIVDDEHLRKHDLRPGRQPMRALKNGSIICVLGDPGKQEVKLIVRIPNRGDHEDVYEEKLIEYLKRRGKVATFASMRENALGNHWKGGSLYNFSGLLGKGAFATVYRIQTKQEGTYYAAKELDKRRFMKNGILDTKFDSELKIMKDLKHPNIVEYIDCQQHQHYFYIIMEYVPHGELSKELEKRKFLPEDQVQQIAKQIMRALDYLHRRNITHRDIKPDNILIASKDPLVVKLSDFGLSKCINDQETFLKTFCGTLLYCAPEVYPHYSDYTSGPAKRRRPSKTSPYDQSVDMWSFGAVLFHLLCGKAPVMGRGDDRGAQMLDNIMTKDINFKPLLEHGVSPAGIDFVSRLLNRNPLLRPREKECLEHDWVRDLVEVCKYNEDDQIPDYIMQRKLDAVEELDEDLVDEELMQDLHQLTQHPMSSEPGMASSPERPIKKPRMFEDSVTIPAGVAYPQLPEATYLTKVSHDPPQGPRLFGEIGAPLRQRPLTMDHPSLKHEQRDVPDIRQAIAQVSVNDYAAPAGLDPANATDVMSDPMKYPIALKLPIHLDGTAPSLLGAEAQIGQLNMASPEHVPSDAATPETTNPVTPRTREISPISSATREADDDLHHSSASDVKFSRRIDATLLRDEAAFAASVHARDVSRAEKRQQKNDTFLVDPQAPVTGPSTYAAAMTDGSTGLAAKSAPKLGRVALFTRTISLPNTTDRPLTCFGRLVPVDGSCGQPEVITLESRLTSWGRGVDCTVRYPNLKDTRVPKYAIKITFWAKGIEKCVAQGGDWTTVPGIQTLISTSTSHQIWVNDTELRKQSTDGNAALYGKVYSGDVITVHDGGEPYEFLKYRIEIMFGDSARPRPDKEKPFVTQRETYHHRIQKERESMRQSCSDGERGELGSVTALAT